MNRAVLLNRDLIVESGPLRSMPPGAKPIPAELAHLSDARLRFDGDGFIDAASVTDWLVDPSGNKRLAIMHPDSDWPLVACGWDEKLRRDGDGVWFVETDDDRLAALEAATLIAWQEKVAAARATIAGTADPAKLAEYADKAANAQAVIDGTAAADIVAEAEAEAASLGLTTAVEVAELWQTMAADLRATRTLINVLDREQRAAIARRSSIDGYAEALELATAALDALLADLQAEA